MDVTYLACCSSLMSCLQGAVDETIYLSVLRSGSASRRYRIRPRERLAAKVKGRIVLTFPLACRTHANRVSTTCIACGTNSSLPRSPQSIGGAIVESTATNDTNNGTNEIQKGMNLTNQSSNQAQRKFMKHRPRRRHEHTPFLDRDGHIVICGNNPVRRRSGTDGELTSTISPL